MEPVATALCGFAKLAESGRLYKGTLRLTDFTSATLSPNVEAVISAFLRASLMAFLIRVFFISAHFLSDKLKCMSFIILAPADILTSIHFDTLAVLELTNFI